MGNVSTVHCGQERHRKPNVTRKSVTQTAELWNKQKQKFSKQQENRPLWNRKFLSKITLGNQLTTVDKAKKLPKFLPEDSAATKKSCYCDIKAVIKGVPKFSPMTEENDELGANESS